MQDHSLSVRLKPETIERLDAVAAKMSRPGLEVTRTDVVRMALDVGLRQMEKARVR